jgi:putative endonuclease
VGEPWFLYLVECRDGTLYTGVARDVARRAAAHDAGRGARYTRGRGPVKVLLASGPLDKREAHRLERWLKRRPRSGKLAALRALGGRRPRLAAPGRPRLRL